VDRIEEALDGLSARDAERLKALLEKRLQSCVSQRATFTLLICPACIEKHRLPEGRSEG
jgi:hypothetical protein